MTNEQALQGILKAIEKHPNDRGAYSDLITLSKIEPNSADYVRSAKKILSNNMNNNMLEIMRMIDLRLGRESFLEFLNAIEIDRPESVCFWSRRKHILEDKHHIGSTISDFVGAKSLDRYYLSLSMATGLGKSAIISFLIAYIMGKNPYARGMYCGYTSKLPQMTYERVKGIIDPNGEYNFMDIFFEFPMQTIVFDNKELNIRIDQSGKSQANAKKNDPIFSFVSVDGSITGVTRASGDKEHGKGFLICDDLVADNIEAANVNAMDKLWDLYTGKLLTRMLGEDNSIICLGTIWGNFDPIVREMVRNKDNPKYTFLTYPARDKNGESVFDFGIPGEGYTTEALNQREKDIDPVDFNCIYMCVPTSKQGLMFERSTLNWYDGTLPQDRKPDAILMATDMAFGGGDYLASIVGYCYDEKVYIPDVICSNMGTDITQPLVIKSIIKNKVQIAEFEVPKGGELFQVQVSNELEELGENCVIRWKPASNRMAKSTRIAQSAPHIKRDFYFLEYSKQNYQYKEFMKWFCAMTANGAVLHDDPPDAAAMLNVMRENPLGNKTTQVKVLPRLF